MKLYQLLRRPFELLAAWIDRVLNEPPDARDIWENEG